MKRFIMSPILISIGFIIVGAILFSISLYAILSPKGTYEKVEAEIVNIEEEYNAVEETYDHRVYVDYTADGKKYSGVELGAYSSSMKVGNKITAEYNVDDPSEIRSEDSWIVPYITGAGGALALIGGIIAICFDVKRRRG